MTDPNPGRQGSTREPIFTREEVAARAGVELAFIERLCELGILVPADGMRHTEGDARRARILHALSTSGMPLEAIGEGVRRGLIDLAFVDDPAYALFAGQTGETFAAASRRTGIPFEVL